MSGFQSGRQAEPRRPIRAEPTRGILSLELSADRDVQRVHCGGVNSLDIDATGGRYLLSGGADGVVAVYDLENLAVRTVGKAGRHHAHAFGVEAVQWYPRDAGMFVSSSLDGTVKAWDAETLTPAEVFRFRGRVFCHHMSPVAAGRHSLVAVGTEGPEVRLCDLKSGSLAHALRGHGAEVLSVRWSPRHEHVLATAGADGGVRVWDVRRAAGSLFALDRRDGDKSKATAATASAHGGRVNGLCFSGDGLFLLSTGTDDRMRLWNSATGEQAPVNYGEVSNGSRRRGLKFAVSGGRGGSECVLVPRGSSVAVYAMHTGQMVALLRGHYGNVDCCHFHPDHQELYSGGRDCNILAWVPLRHRPDAEDNPAFRDSWSSDED